MRKHSKQNKLFQGHFFNRGRAWVILFFLCFLYFSFSLLRKALKTKKTLGPGAGGLKRAGTGLIRSDELFAEIIRASLIEKAETAHAQSAEILVQDPTASCSREPPPPAAEPPPEMPKKSEPSKEGQFLTDVENLSERIQIVTGELDVSMRKWIDLINDQSIVMASNSSTLESFRNSLGSVVGTMQSSQIIQQKPEMPAYPKSTMQVESKGTASKETRDANATARSRMCDDKAPRDLPPTPAAAGGAASHDQAVASGIDVEMDSPAPKGKKMKLKKARGEMPIPEVTKLNQATKEY